MPTYDLLNNLLKRSFPFSSETFEAIDDLPSAGTRGADNSTNCDVCSKKGVKNKPAHVYCGNCDEKYCTKHQEVGLCCDHVSSLLLLGLSSKIFGCFKALN